MGRKGCLGIWIRFPTQRLNHLIKVPISLIHDSLILTIQEQEQQKQQWQLTFIKILLCPRYCAEFFTSINSLSQLIFQPLCEVGGLIIPIS